VNETRDDPELGPVRRCRVCGEEWPLGAPFYRPRGATCEACLSEREKAWRPSPPRGRTSKLSTAEVEERRRRDRERKAAARRDPVRGAREREMRMRHYWRNHEAFLERRRQDYAESIGRPVRVGWGRPRIAA
jgi:hypothetical protein